MKEKKILRDYNNIITYSEDKWALLKDKRINAIKLLEIFVKEGFNPFVYGSIARGDVHESSDIDITFVQKIPSFQVEYILHKNGYENYFREIIMATPLDSIKLYIYLSELESITVPLTKFEKNAIEFYNFGGKIALNGLQSGNRVPGIDNQDGHEESSVIGNEALAAKQVGVGINTVNERIRVLLRREKYGRTGVYLKRTLQLDESTEDVLKKLAKKKRIVRKKLLKS